MVGRRTAVSPSHVATLLLLLGSDFIRPTPPAATAVPIGLEPSVACVDFASGGYPGSSWTLPDCLTVWEEFIRSAPDGLRRRLSHVDVWRETAEELRRAGKPCLVASDPTSDGAGSSTIRHFATWIYAEQMGCDWVTPDWGKKRVDQGNSSSAGSPVIYCHRTATTTELDLTKPPEQIKAMQRCTVIDWLSYFQFGVPSVPWPHDQTLWVIQVREYGGMGHRRWGGGSNTPLSVVGNRFISWRVRGDM